MTTHIVWDWNGTLFDDVTAVVAATNEIFVGYGLGPYTTEEYRAVHTRPIWVAYERMLGRSLEDGEWERLDASFHDAYHRLMEQCRLAADARHTLDALAGAGHSQSLLSMWQHERLIAKVRLLGIAAAFRRVDGLADGRPGASKAEFLFRHLRVLGLDARDVLMVGDSLDDAGAARAAGARAVLYAGGMQTRADLRRSGVPVVDRLSDVANHL